MASQDMASASLAERYASAYLELAEDAKALSEVESDLTRLSALIEESADLQRLLRSPVESRKVQLETMSLIMDAAQVHPLTKRLVLLLAANRRLQALSAIIEASKSKLAQRRGEVPAQVISAVKLSREQVASIANMLKKSIGANVALTEHVDPGILGGLIVKIGSRMVDSSLRTKLQRLQLAIKGMG